MVSDGGGWGHPPHPFKSERDAETTQLDTNRAELDRQETEVKKQWAFLATLLEWSEPFMKKVMRWLSHPDLPAEMKREGIDIAAEAVSVLGSCGRTIRIRDALRRMSYPMQPLASRRRVLGRRRRPF